MTRPAPFIGLALLVAAPASLVAQQATRDTAALRPVVTTATLSPLPGGALTASLTRLDGDSLRAAGVRFMADALRAVPGAAVVQSGSTGATTSLFLRGGESDYVQVIVDGVPANEPGGGFDFAHLTLDNVERIEVLRGPASVLYGANAVTGVVRIVTHDGRGPASLHLRAAGGERDSRELAGEARVGVRRAALSLGAGRRTTEGFLPFNNGYENRTGSASLLVHPTALVQARLTGRLTDGEFHFPTNGFGVPVDSNAFSTNRSGSTALEVTAGSRRVQGRVLLDAARERTSSDNHPDNTSDTLGFYYRSRAVSSRQGADARLSWLLSRATVLTLGGGAERQRVRTGSWSQFQSFPASDTTLPANHRRNSAMYGELAGTLRRGVTYTLGLRRDDNQRFGTFGTWRAAAAWVFATGTRVRGAAGTAFKEPTFAENYASSYYERGNRELDPERSRGWELGVEQAVAGERVTVGATWFDQRFRDLILYSPALRPIGGGRDSSNYFNVAEARAGGLELEARIAPVGPMSLRGSYTYLTTEVLDAGFESAGDASFVRGKPLLRRPAHTASLGMRLRLGGAASVSVDASRVGERSDLRYLDDTGPQRVTLHAYTTVDVGGEAGLLRATGLRPGVSLTARVANLFDERYEAVAGFAAPRRLALVGVRLDAGR